MHPKLPYIYVECKLTTIYTCFIKVTGRVLRTGKIDNVEDILALPDLNSPARSPTFNYRLTINSDRKEAEPGMLAFLRVYTVDPVRETIGVIGSCLVPFFEPNKVGTI